MDRHYRNVTEVKKSKRRDSDLIGWVFVFVLIGGGIGWISTILNTSSEKKGESSYSYSHCYAGSAEQFLFKNARSTKSQIEYLKLISENGNMFTFS